MSIALVASRRGLLEYDDVLLVEEYTAGVRGVVVGDVYGDHSEQSPDGPLFDIYDQVVSIADWKTWTVAGEGRLLTSNHNDRPIREYKYPCERKTRGGTDRYGFWEDEIKLKPKQLYKPGDIVRLPRNRDNWTIVKSDMAERPDGRLSYLCELRRIRWSTGRPATGDDPKDVKTVWQDEIAGYSS